MTVDDTISGSIKTLTGSLSEYPNHYLTSDIREGRHIRKSRKSVLKAIDELNRAQSELSIAQTYIASQKDRKGVRSGLPNLLRGFRRS